MEAAAMLAALVLAAKEFVLEIKDCKGKQLCKGEAYEAGVVECERPAGVPEEGI
jgi:hypothetical protein